MNSKLFTLAGSQTTARCPRQSRPTQWRATPSLLKGIKSNNGKNTFCFNLEPDKISETRRSIAIDRRVKRLTKVNRRQILFAKTRQAMLAFLV